MIRNICDEFLFLLKEVREKFGLSPEKFENILKVLSSRGRIYRLSPKVIYHPEAFERAKGLVLDYIHKHGSITMAEFRDLCGFSRKYAQAILEYLNLTGTTKRDGDRHIRVNITE